MYVFVSDLFLTRYGIQIFPLLLCGTATVPKRNNSYKKGSPSVRRTLQRSQWINDFEHAFGFFISCSGLFHPGVISQYGGEDFPFF